ncbi:MAG: sulfotransferase [Pleurocapsa sp.]
MSFSNKNFGKIKIISIAGFGRSGTTILGNILGSISGFFHTGETCFLWENGINNNRNCGCGLPFRQCSLWHDILKNAYGNLENLKDINIKYLKQQGIPQNRDILPALIFKKRKENLESVHENLKKYLINQEKLYRSIANHTNCDVIIDSSKFPSYVYLLNLISSIDLYVVHLVRDPRAVAYSWQKKRIRSDVSTKNNLLQEQFKPTKVALQWNAWNLLLEFFGNKELKQHYLFLKYEQFMQNPQQTVKSILNFVGEADKELPFVDSSSVSLTVNHTIWGNPIRSKTGLVKLKTDEQWKDKISPSHRKTVVAITLPLLLKYGYINNAKT